MTVLVKRVCERENRQHLLNKLLALGEYHPHMHYSPLSLITAHDTCVAQYGAPREFRKRIEGRYLREPFGPSLFSSTSVTN